MKNALGRGSAQQAFGLLEEFGPIGRIVRCRLAEFTDCAADGGPDMVVPVRPLERLTMTFCCGFVICHG